MLRHPRDFEILQREGASRANPLFVVRARPTDLPATRFGISVGRRVGGAVVRNRVRRRLREALRAMAPSLRPGWDVLLVARPPIAEASSGELASALRGLLRRSGVLAEGSGA